MSVPLAAPIGTPLPRPATRRLLQGRGRYVDDFVFPRMVHVAFVRSPHAKAAIEAIDGAAARCQPGVVAVVTGRDLQAVCRGWRGDGKIYPGFAPPEQRALAVDAVAYQGEPVAAVVAHTRAQAEDAAELVAVRWQAMVPTPDLARSAAAEPVHPQLERNLGFQAVLGQGDFERVAARAHAVVHDCFDFARQTGAPLEARGLVADFEPVERSLTVHHSHQVPNEIQTMFSALLGLDEHRVRIVCPDVGGAFGVKLHLYADELATAAIATLLSRPVKYIADRAEGMLTDVHAREHRIEARLAVDAEGRMLAMQVRDLFGMGAYSTAPRTSLSEAMLAIRFMGVPYDIACVQATLDAVFQNRAPTGQYRAVGMPIGCMVTERLVDHAARALGMDPAELRRRNFVGAGGRRSTSALGMPMFELSHHECLERLLTLADWPGLARERDALRARGVYRGLGLAVFVEPSGPGSEINGRAEVPVIAMDSATVKLEPSGGIRCLTSTSDQGQGTSAGIAQIVAAALGVAPEQVNVSWGDTAYVPPGGGAWASRGIVIGGEAAWAAARRLRTELLILSGLLASVAVAELDIHDGAVVTADGRVVHTLRQLAETAYFRGYQIPAGHVPQLAVTHQYRRGAEPFVPANGIQASHVEVDVETGRIRLLRHWVVEDCGTLINPLLVDEQIRGGVVQGLGPALFEACRYDASGRLLTATLADYLVPTAADVPDIVIGHVHSRYTGSALGAKGVGEGGTCGAAAAVLNAVNDALAPLDASVTCLPMTPAVVLRALGKLDEPS